MSDDMLNDAEFEHQLEQFDVESGWKFVARQQHDLQQAVEASTQRRDAQCAVEAARITALENINRRALSFGGLGGGIGASMSVVLILLLKWLGVNI